MLTDKTNEIIKEANELKEYFIKEIAVDMFDDMETEELAIMKKCFKLMDRSMELAVEQAKVMDGLNDKLDKLLAIMEKCSD